MQPATPYSLRCLRYVVRFSQNVQLASRTSKTLPVIRQRNYLLRWRASCPSRVCSLFIPYPASSNKLPPPSRSEKALPVIRQRGSRCGAHPLVRENEAPEPTVHAGGASRHPRVRLEAVLKAAGPSWGRPGAVLGAVLGALGAVLGPSWGPPGPTPR